MKTQPDNRKPETLEDIVFEGRNKSYGAYDMNRKRVRYLIYAFLISFIGVSTAVAIPFINQLKKPSELLKGLEHTTKVEIADINDKLPDVPPPPEPPPIENMEKMVVYQIPDVVEKVEDPNVEFSIDVIDRAAINPPVDIEIPVYDDPSAKVIEEPVETVELFPQEPAMFMGGDLNEFSKWVLQNVQYPQEAVDAAISGKIIIEFCVNSKGKVVDIKLLRSLFPGLDNETIKVIENSPAWTPAKQGGRPVKQRFTIPVFFKLL